MGHCFHTLDYITDYWIYGKCILIDVTYAISPRSAEDMTITYCVMSALKN
ncbi:hypothetical protein HMPREF3037_00373 [Candidatus Stoquefichus sp. KLE1796]|nr:hypothetical protein HMPREF3037_00373 [Candidatus Stoquefichus sp. KLE1796]